MKYIQACLSKKALIERTNKIKFFSEYSNQNPKVPASVIKKKGYRQK
jgi:hypothetical protein